MSTTLTNGLKLPDKGSVDWYADMQSNYAILDGAVGTVAEHTTQIAGKAPAVHTHTKADITDFPAYGTTAGTICEGNDSRLSDARTPVAHTHTKSDVTDLFNSANTWTGDNTYTATINYQSSYTLGNPPQSAAAQVALKVIDTAGTNYLAQIAAYQSTDSTGVRITIRDKFDSNGFSPSGSNRNRHLYFVQNTSNQSYIQWDGYANNSIVPLVNNTYDLGTPTNKWKTLNGVNPGALSLPFGSSANAIEVDITNWYVSDPNDPDPNGVMIDDSTEFDVTSLVPGWLWVKIPNIAGNYAYTRRYANVNNMDSQMIADGLANDVFSNVKFIFPITPEGLKVRIKAKTATVRIFPCLGNV